MAKSLRSKVKRHYQFKKHEEGVYTASTLLTALRLLSKFAKIRGREMKDLIQEVDGDEERVDYKVAGSSWFLLLSLLNHCL